LTASPSSTPGCKPAAEPIAEALAALGADWADVSDIVITHSHPDHVGGLPLVTSKAPKAARWSGDGLAVTATPAEDGSSIHGLRVIATPRHTPGHICLLDEDHGLLFTGDAVSAQAGRLSQGPAAFIANPEQASTSLPLIAGLRAQRMLFGHGPELEDPSGALTSLLANSANEPTRSIP
jgi:glyoxylase-like metal-dependent hydrolase (beta-lactamase superfamily II)